MVRSEANNYVANLHVAEIGTTTVRLAWDACAGAQSYQIEYGLHNFTSGNGTVVTSPSNAILISGLTSTTNYDFYVKPYLGSTLGYGLVEMVSATTECAPVALPYAENFNNLGTNSSYYTTSAYTPPTRYQFGDHYLPSCWRFPNITQTI